MAYVVITVRASVCLMYVPGAGQGLESSEIPSALRCKAEVGGR